MSLQANKARNTLAIKKREQALLPVYRQVHQYFDYETALLIICFMPLAVLHLQAGLQQCGY